nr:hypothetical protein [Tanacetum cinerariifolium]
MYMAKLQQVSPDVDDSGPIFDKEPEPKVQNDDHYDVFAIDCQHSEQSDSVHNTYLIEQDAQNVLIESKDMTYDSEQIEQNDEDVNLAKEPRVANPLTLVAQQQQQANHHYTHPTYFNQNSSTRTHQSATKKREKAAVNSPQPIYDQEPSMVDDDEDTNAGYEGQRSGTVAGARDTVGSSMVQKSGQRSGTIAGSKDTVGSSMVPKSEPEQKVQNDDDYDVFAIDCQHSEQSESVHNTYLTEQDAQNVLIESEDMTYDSEQIDQNDEDVDLAKEPKR